MIFFYFIFFACPWINHKIIIIKVACGEDPPDSKGLRLCVVPRPTVLKTKVEYHLSTVQYSSCQYSTVQYSTVLYSTQYSTVAVAAQYSIVCVVSLTEIIVSTIFNILSNRIKSAKKISQYNGPIESSLLAPR